MTLVHIGEGRFLKHTEGALSAPPPEPKRVYKSIHKANPLRPPAHKRPNKKNHALLLDAKIPGYPEYRSYYAGMSLRYREPFQQYGALRGYNRNELAALRALADIQVQKDMSNIKKNVELSDMAEEALEGALHILRAPSSQQTKLAAAKLILEFTKTKPVAKSEVSVNKAEEWLASLAHDD